LKGQAGTHLFSSKHPKGENDLHGYNGYRGYPESIYSHPDGNNHFYLNEKQTDLYRFTEKCYPMMPWCFGMSPLRPPEAFSWQNHFASRQ